MTLVFLRGSSVDPIAAKQNYKSKVLCFISEKLCFIITKATALHKSQMSKDSSWPVVFNHFFQMKFITFKSTANQITSELCSFFASPTGLNFNPAGPILLCINMKAHAFLQFIRSYFRYSSAGWCLLKAMPPSLSLIWPVWLFLSIFALGFFHFPTGDKNETDVILSGSKKKRITHNRSPFWWIAGLRQLKPVSFISFLIICKTFLSFFLPLVSDLGTI